MFHKSVSVGFSSLRGMVLAGALLLGGACTPQDSQAGGMTQGEQAGTLGQFCGGIAAIQCPAGQACVDDPTDSCNPAQGGADCGGICVKDTPQCTNPARTFVSRDPDKCALLRFFCEPGKSAFFDDCGCGCEPAQ